MNDRFRFRFWHKSKNRYVNTEKLILNDGTYTQVGTKQMNNGTYCSYIVNEYNTSEIIPEQCTGLKDKNGKLIYEGDICIPAKDMADNAGEVYRAESGAYFVKGKMKSGMEYDFGIYWHHYKYEVIGNIHENKDLLEVNND